MNGDPNIQVLTARQSRKRQHHETVDSHSQSRSSSPWGYGEPSRSNNSSQSFFSATRPTLPPLPALRFPGDGYDFRRPVMTTPSAPRPPSPPSRQENVIDLTDEPDSLTSDLTLRTPPAQQRSNRSTRPPRFGRNIMADVVELEDGSPNFNEVQQLSSPEVQFISAAVRRDEEHRRSHSRAATQRRQDAPPPLRGSSLIDMIRRMHRTGQPADFSRPQEVLRDEVGLRNRNITRAFNTNIPPFWIGERPIDGIDLTVDLDDDDVPIQLDYRAAGFGVAGQARRAPPPEYEPPPAPPAGFTRTVDEDDVVVCPNCDHELGTGEDMQQRQIWVAKPCGHVYCGRCAKNRALSSRKRSESNNLSPTKTKPFSKCVVSDCGKPISQPRAMFQMYL
ncbi:hypothetical protein FQN55_008385 [Onygenales sp. PD_40]|nr:hypothetical protein FQN55_008385 [Onygenales sp. PD_40]